MPGAAEQELDRRCGPGTIDRIAAGVRPTGKIKAVARREMSVAFTIRAVLLMTLMPDADSREVLTTLLGQWAVGSGLRLDGTVTRMPDTAANRAAFGTAGAAETGYPQIRHLHVSARMVCSSALMVLAPGTLASRDDSAEPGKGRRPRPATACPVYPIRDS